MGKRLTENFWRKLHSLSGIIPVGVFLVFHLTINSAAIQGEQVYNDTIAMMDGMPFKLFMEIFIIAIPLLFHGLYGIHLALQSKNNVGRYKYVRNWNFYFQRLTGVIAFVFVIWHVWGTRIQVALGNADVNFQLMADVVANPIVLILYIIGTVSSVFHLANGLFTFFITWGVTVTPKSQKYVQYIAMAFFVIVSVVATATLIGFTQ